MMNETGERRLGLLQATGVGVGAIVGGGVLALAGVAFATTGPSAILAFALNGLIAFLTALTFAEMSAAFPVSGGTYAFAKKVLSVEAAFFVGWIVWFASIVAGVLYALGFAAYTLLLLERLWQMLGGAPPAWLGSRLAAVALAAAATSLYAISLVRSAVGGGQWATVGKVVVFSILILGGLWALRARSLADVESNLRPFFSGGAVGLVQAMGYSFIALQGFDLIAAVAGEVRDARRNVPRAMLLSLAIALLIYLPLLFVMVTVGIAPGASIAAASAAQPETIVAEAARHFLGETGFWLVVAAAVMSMLSALHANLFAASRFAFSMANDRTLPTLLGSVNPIRATPVAAIVTTWATLVVLLCLLPDVAAAGAASSLIFLLSFALTHWTNILARRRSHGALGPFRVPWFPLVPIAGGGACLGLAVFQGFAVPSAGGIVALWLAVGGGLFVTLFARRARVSDASAQATDPELVRLRGRSPLVLVPIANPDNAAAMVAVANALCPPKVGRVILLSIVASENDSRHGSPAERIRSTQAVLGEALGASLAAGLAPEVLATVAGNVWEEIARVARTHRCESLLLGFTSLDESTTDDRFDRLISRVDNDVVILRASRGWQPDGAQRILVPLGGRGAHDLLRARLLSSLCRTAEREVTYLRVLPASATRLTERDARRGLARVAEDEVPGAARVELVRTDESPSDVICRYAEDSDLVLLGLQRFGRRRKVLGDLAATIARRTTCPLVMISRRG